MLSLLMPFLGPAIDRLVGLIPDPSAAAKARAEAIEQVLAAAQAVDQAQSEINKVEAASSSVFVAGWRPFIGWVLGCALGFQFILRPFLIWGCDIAHVPVMNIPGLDDNLWQLMTGMLGLGGLRTYEKAQGIQDSKIASPKPSALKVPDGR